LKKSFVWILVLIFLSGCSSTENELDTGMQLRSKILQASQCSFSAEITADYGDRIFFFTTACKTDNMGNVFFTVTAPDTISGISGNLSGESGNLIFTDMAVAFPLLAEDLPSPISAPWLFLNALRSGFIASACTEDNRIRLSVDDTFEDNALRLDIWLGSDQLPRDVDILWDGNRILTMRITEFHIS
jgi:hypothetical protein